MLRRRFVVFRRRRLFGAALFGGLGFAAGRASKRSPQAGADALSAPPQPTSPDVAEKLKELAGMHASGALSDAEFAAAKAKLLGS